MLFPTIQYAFFFLIVYSIYWSLCSRPKVRKVFLLCASYFFYMVWDVRFGILLFCMSIVAYSLGSAIAESVDKDKKRHFLNLHLATTLVALGIFKYFDFFRESAEALLHGLGLSVMVPGLEILLPVGISFMTFQTLTYTIDLSRGDGKPAKSALDFFVYVSFFPNLLAGPITRARHLLPQFESAGPQRVISPSLAFSFLISGLFKKLIISTYIQTHLVDDLFLNPFSFSGAAVAAGIYGYAVQIYCDFSGYSDMAIGSAMLLGIRLPDNFNKPYLAVNPQDFWRRWHISFSFWLRDYLYISLGGNRKGRARTYRNIMYTMILGGLWHGAQMTFIIWGALHGVFQVIYHIWLEFGKKRLKKKKSLIGLFVGWLITFHLVCFAWVFFRATDFQNAISVFSAMIQNVGEQGVEFSSILMIGFGLLFQVVGEQARTFYTKTASGLPLVFQAIIMGAIFIAILKMGPDEVPPFLYFKF